MMMIPNTVTPPPGGPPQLIAKSLCPADMGRENNIVVPGGDKLLPSLLQQIAKASTSLQNKPWPVSVPATFTSSVSEITSAPAQQHPTVTMCKLENNTLANQVFEQQLANQLLERYSQQLTPNTSQHFSTPLSTKLLTTNNSLLSNTLTTNNTLLSNHLLNNPQLSHAQHVSQPLILPRYTNHITPVNSPRLIMKQDEGNSRRLRWKEEHGKALISIWKDKYPQVRAAKKIKEKHAVWHEIGDAYNKLCTKYDWPPRSTDQVKIKVKNCIDEYKQTIKYNQEYKTCPYFQDIDDIFGMSDPEKSAELQNHHLTSPITEINSDNIYWSGTSLPTQVKKRKLNISCKPVEEEGTEGKENEHVAKRTSPPSRHSHPSHSPNQVQSTHQDIYLLNLQNSSQTGSAAHSLKTKSEVGKVAEEPRYEVKLGGSSHQHAVPDTPFKYEPAKSPDPPTAISIPQFGNLLKQMHERELQMVEMYHKIDSDRRNSYLQRERERYEAEFQLEESRQKFLGDIVEKLINVIKDKGLAERLDKSSLLARVKPTELVNNPLSPHLDVGDVDVTHGHSPEN